MSPLPPKKKTTNKGCKGTKGSSLVSLVSSRAATQPTLRGRALRLLARRDWSREALRKRLLSAPIDDAECTDATEVDALLDDFAARGWLSDARYAEAIVRSRQSRYGKTAIARRLKQAGVTDDDAATALAVIDDEQEFQTAVTLLRRKFREPPTGKKETARQVRFLQARGYSLRLALRALKESAAQE